MSVRKLLIDACVAPTVADRLRSEGHDVIGAFDRGPDVSDQALLALAVQERRIVVTIDSDFGALVFRDGLARAGVLRIREAAPQAQAERASALVGLYGDVLEAGAFVVDDGETARVRLSLR